jgi:amidase
MDETELSRASAAETAAAVRAKVVAPSEVVDAAIARAQRLNPELNALVFTAFGEARDAARRADDIAAAGEDLPPLLGVPTAIKDLFGSKPGWPVTFGGIPALRDHVVPVPCLWAERMEAAGAILLGKTNSPVLGFRGTCDNPLFGSSRNPFDPSRNTGGSSGGAAGAVASRMLPLAEATDAGGSIRIPASWCGLVGLKPSWGRVPRTARPDAFGAANPFVAEATVARTTEDVALALAVLAGPDPADPYALPETWSVGDALTRGVAGTRIAYSADFGGFPVEREVREVVEDAVRAMELAGARVDPVDLRLPRDSQELAETWCRLIAARNLEIVLSLKDAGFDGLGVHSGDLPSALLGYIRAARDTTVHEYAQLQAVRTEVFDVLQSVLADVDLLLTPTTAVLPVLNGADGTTVGPTSVAGHEVNPLIGWCLTFLQNLTGHPAASVPAGTANGLPVGLQVTGRLGADGDVLAACAALEQIRPWAHAYDEAVVSAGR